MDFSVAIVEIIVGYVSTVLEIFVLHLAQEHCSLRNNNELKMHLQLSSTDLKICYYYIKYGQN